MRDDRIIIEFDARRNNYTLAFIIDGNVVLPVVEIPRVSKPEEMGAALLSLRQSIDVAYAKLVMNLK